MDYKYNYSFIIPHKNLPDLLARCVSSIPCRDDVEIIIVDDNSDPAVVDFDSFPFITSENVKIIYDKSGKRQGHARNIGIDKAEGKWLVFADSDDFFFYSINQALDDYVNSDADIIYFKATILDNETYLPSSNQDCIPNISVNKYFSGDKYGEHFVRFRYPVPWGKFIKSSLVHKYNIKFAEIERLEDVQFSYQCGYYATNIIVNNYSIYCYVKRSNTVTSQITKKSRYTFVKVCADYIKFLFEKKLEDTPVFNIIKDMLFDNFMEMKRINDEFYGVASDYLSQLNLPPKFIDDNMKRMTLIHAKVKIYSFFRRIRHYK